MNAKELHAFRSALHEKGIVFCYSGYMTEQILTGIAQALKSKLAIDETDKQVARGVFSLLIEQVQNVIRYSAEFEPPDDEKSVLRYGILIIGNMDDTFYVTCGNMVRNEDVPRLNRNLTEVKKMDREELKLKYKELLRSDAPEGSKGAGVGFIDIARRARNGFTFDFHPVDDSLSYFSLVAYV